MPGFSQPLWLLGLLALPALWYFWRVADRRRKKEAIEFSSLAALKAARRPGAAERRILVLSIVPLLALGLLFVALADPFLPLGTVRQGANVVLVIDDSGSMQATDYRPTRLEAAKEAGSVLVGQLGSQDRIGVVIFESGATTAGYLTPDKERIRQRLSSIQPKTGQTALGDGLTLGVEMADSLPNAKNVVVLLSDGVSNAGVVDPLRAAGYAKERGVTVFTVGLGSPGPVVVGTDLSGRPEYAELDEATLREIADTTGGSYFTSVNESTLSAIYRDLPAVIGTETEETGVGYTFVIAAIALIIGEFYLRYGKGRILP